MSVDIEEMAAHLDKQRRNDVKEQYDQRATHATTAFLLCFFLGYLGAHRFYLGQWRSGLAQLAMFALGAAGVVTAFLSAAPLKAALFVIGAVLILASLIWEIIDLGRIDDEIHRRNLLLAEGLIAGALLSDPTAVEEAAGKLDEAIHTAAAQSSAAGVAHDTSAFAAGMISAEDLAQARALAEESGRASISYHELSNFMVSATPEERAGATPMFEPTTVIERQVSEEPTPADPEVAPEVEAQTHIHTEDAYRVTDAEETDRVSGPSAAEAIGLGAAALGAAEAGLGMAEAAQPHETLASEPASELASEPSATPAPEPAIAQAPEPAIAQAPEPPYAEVTATLQPESIAPAMEPPAPLTPVTPEAPAEPVTPIEASAPTETAAPASLAAPRFGGDITDAGAPSFIELAADVAFASSYPGYIALPEEPAPAPVEPIFASSDGYEEPFAETSAADAVTEPEIPLYVTPEEAPQEETAPTYVPPAAPEPPAESYVPPVPDVYSAAAPQPETYTPSWETPTALVPPAPEPVPPEPAQAPETLAELAGLGAIAGATESSNQGAAAPEAEPVSAEPTPTEPLTAEYVATEAAAEPAKPKMKRIRVKHRIVVEGQVVREETVEREVPADIDMAVAVRQIQAEMEQTAAATPDEIARLANLSANDEVEVHRFVEGLGE